MTRALVVTDPGVGHHERVVASLKDSGIGIVTAPAAFRFTYDADPARHERVAALLGSTEQGPDALPNALSSLMADLEVPSLTELGYGEDDIPDLVEGALAQQRLLTGTPKEVGATDLATILRASL